MDLDVLCVGELLVDFISTEQVDSVGEAGWFKPVVGGQAANVAVNVARLGGRSALVARVGTDGLGNLCSKNLADAGVDTSLLINDPVMPTSLSVIARSTSTPDFIVYRGADRCLEPADIPAEMLQATRAVHASSFLLSHEPSRSAVLAALSQAKAAGALVSLDPTYHPSVWGREQQPLPVLQEAYRFVDVTKPSLDDCHRIFGPGESPETYARQFLEMGARLVVLTLGAGGAVLATIDGVVQRFPGRKVPVADVTGAGDAFWSGLLMALLDGLSDDEAVKVGMEVALIKIQRAGPLSSSLDRQAIYRRATMTGA